MKKNKVRVRDRIPATATNRRDNQRPRSFGVFGFFQTLAFWKNKVSRSFGGSSEVLRRRSSALRSLSRIKSFSLLNFLASLRLIQTRPSFQFKAAAIFPGASFSKSLTRISERIWEA